MGCPPRDGAVQYAFCTQCMRVMIDTTLSVHCIEVNNNKIINVIVGLIKKIAKPHHPDEST